MPVFVIFFAPFNKLIAMTVPTIYAVMGFTSDWDVLYNDAFRNKIFLVSIIIVLASTIFSIIPFLFYDLTEEKHRRIIEDLKQRAADMDSAAEMETRSAELEAAAE
jgi:Na+/melibiose symporter-like transporter